MEALTIFQRVQKFCMESARLVIVLLQPEDLLASMDIRNTYLQIPIFPPYQGYLHFAVGKQHYQFVSLPFDLSTTPWVFTKVLAQS